MRRLLPIWIVLASATSLFAQRDFGPERKDDVIPLVDLPDVLKPLSGRSEAEEDQLTAAAHFAQARLQHAKGKSALALKHYQRAWRYDSDSNQLLAEIVPLAFEAKQSDAAARYAVLAAERDPKDALLVRRLAIYLTDKRDYVRAVRMYEKSLAKNAQLANGMPEDFGAAAVYAELGRLYYLTEKYQEAARTFAIVRRAIEDKDSHFDEAIKKSILGEAATTYALWGEAFLDAGRYDEAASAFQKANDAKKDAPLLAFRLARVAVGQNKLDEAAKQLDEYFAAKTDSSGDDPYELLSKITLQQATNPVAGQEALISKLRKLHNEQPQNVPLAFALADALWTAGKFETAVPLLTKTLARQPDSDRYARLIKHHWEQKEYRELLAVAGQLAERNGSLEAIRELLKELKQDQGLIKGVISLAREQAAVKDPKPNHAPILAAALLVREADQLQEAGELFQLVLDLSPPNPLELQTQWAIGLFLDDHQEPAAVMFRKVLDSKPPPRNASAIRYYLAGALTMGKKTDEALQEMRKAVEANPNNPRYESRIAWILYQAKRMPEAAEEYEKLIEKHSAKQQPEFREILRSARLALSNIALEQGNFPQAVEWLEQVLDEYPEDPGALNDLGYLWAERGLHLQRSLRMTQKAVELEPKNHSYRDSLGWAYFQLGRFDDAARELIAATADNPEADGVLLDHLGDALHKQGKAAEAKQAWQRALEAFQKAGETKKAETVQKKLR